MSTESGPGRRSQRRVQRSKSRQRRRKLTIELMEQRRLLAAHINHEAVPSNADVSIDEAQSVTFKSLAPTNVVTIEQDVLRSSRPGNDERAIFASGVFALNGHNSVFADSIVQSGTVLANGDWSNANYAIGSGATLKGRGTIGSLSFLGVDGTVAPGNSPGVLNTGNFDLPSGNTLEIEIGGTTPGNSDFNHDQVNVSGAVTLAGTLVTTPWNGFVPGLGDSFTIINNDGSEPVVGEFTGLPEGALVRDFLGTGRNAKITYVGGDGNDVVLEAVGTSIVVTNTNASGPGSFYGALVAANASPGLDEVSFDATLTGTINISQQSPLPSIYDPVVIDGTLSPTYEGSPLIGIRGTAAGNVSGLRFAIGSQGSTVRGLSISEFAIHGIVAAADNIRIESNWIGLDLNGNSAGNSLHGIRLAANNAIVGGSTPQSRNVVSGNQQNGIAIGGANASGNVVAGNFIGTNPLGTVAIGNQFTGIYVIGGAHSNRIGTNGDGVGDEFERNVISGNARNGISLQGNQTDGNWVAGNYIGVAADGISPLGNTQRGIHIFNGSQDNIIGTDGSPDAFNDAERNVISGNLVHTGVLISGTNTDRNVVAGNYIGIAADGETAVPNNGHGIAVTAGASDTRIGTDGNGIADAQERNIISGNLYESVVEGQATTGTIIAGNYIGTNARGDLSVANGMGLQLRNGPKNTRIGTDSSDDEFNANERNVISGNSGNGILLRTPNWNSTLPSDGSTTDGTIIAGNYIGLKADGSGVLPNGANGIQLTDRATNTQIGTDGDGVGDDLERNIISGNLASGVSVAGWTAFNLKLADEFISGQIPSTTFHATHNTTDLFDQANGAQGHWTVNEPIPGGGGDRYVIRATGSFHVSVAERYTFALGSDNGARLRIDGNDVITFDQAHQPFQDTLGAVDLSVGLHTFELVGFELIGAAGFEISVNAEEDVPLAITAANGWRLLGASDPLAGLALQGTVDVTTYYSEPGDLGVTIAGNYIGTDPTGELAWGNSHAGIVTSIQARGVQIGGPGESQRNVVSGNGNEGVKIEDTTTRQGLTSPPVVIQNNYIGTDKDGVTAVPNGYSGIGVFGASSYVLIGTDGDGVNDSHEGNLVSGNLNDGVQLSGRQVAYTVVAGNWVGTDASGMHGLGNGTEWFEGGIVVESGAHHNRIGTNADGISDVLERNLVSGNRRGVVLDFLGTDSNTVAGNYVGTNIHGTGTLGNDREGIALWRAANNVIGGSLDVQRNVIAGNRFGVWLGGSGTENNRVLGNYIGTDKSGTLPLGNSETGVLIGGQASDNFIGTGANGVVDANEANVISANALHGILVMDSQTSGNHLYGNRIGTDPTGMQLVGSSNYGVLVRGGALDTMIGGLTVLAGTGLGNVIAGSTMAGVRLETSSDNENRIQGNTIGLASDGSTRLPNAVGISVAATNDVAGGSFGTLVGGTSSMARNVISGNTGSGVQLNAMGSDLDIVVQGNYVGTNRAGTEPRGNDGVGIHVDSTPGTMIGGAVAGAGNVISGNATGVSVTGTSTPLIDGQFNTVIQGNFVGLDAAGKVAIPNTNGILLANADNLIGANADSDITGSERNVISGNLGYGVSIEAPQAGANVVAGNLIGTDVSGTLPLGNQVVGVHAKDGAATIGGVDSGNVIGDSETGIVVESTASVMILGNAIGTNRTGVIDLGHRVAGITVNHSDSAVTVGGTDAGHENLVAFNATGVQVDDGAAAIRGNRIYRNDGVGINTATGPNAPVVNSATIGATTTVAGTLVAAPSSTYHLDFYANRALVDAGTPYQGERYLGWMTLTTQASGSAVFTASGLAAAFLGEYVTATATDAAGNTSAFSLAVAGTTTTPPTIDSDSLLTTIVNPNSADATFGETTDTVNEGQVVNLTGDLVSADASVQVLVDWGDGTSDYATVRDLRSFAASHVYLDDDPSSSALDQYGIFVTAIDADGSGAVLQPIYVRNVAPTIETTDATGTALSAAVANEGDSVGLSGAFSDPGTVDQHTLIVDWGDGTPVESFPIAQGLRVFDQSHVFTSPGRFQVHYSIVDDDREPVPDTSMLGTSGVAVPTWDRVATIQIDNVAPTAVIEVQASAMEGESLSIAALATDPGDVPLSYEWTITTDVLKTVDGVPTLVPEQVFAGNSATFEFTPSLAGRHTVDLIVRDGESQTHATASFDVVNSIPTIHPEDLTFTDHGVAITQTQEGRTVSLSGAFADSSLRDTHRITVDFGDGSPTKTMNAEFGSRSFSGLTHTYVDDPENLTDTYLVTVWVDDGKDVGSTTLPLSVENAVPSVAIFNELITDTQIQFSATVADAGVNDTHSFQWYAGDVLVSTDSLATIQRPVDASGAPLELSIDVTLVVTDDDDGVTTVSTLVIAPQNIDGSNTITIVDDVLSGGLSINVDGSASSAGADVQSVFLLTGAADDTVTVESSISVQVDAGEGNDTVTTGGGDDVLVGGPGDDSLVAGDGQDVLISDEGNDSLNGGAGDDEYRFVRFSDKTLDDGEGIDTLNFEAVAEGTGEVTGIAIDLSQSERQVVYSGIQDGVAVEGSIELGSSTFENVIGTDYKDVLSGNDASNLLYGGYGDDSIDSSGSDDTLDGGDGSDTITGGDGNDSIFGGSGDDSISGGGSGSGSTGDSIDGGDGNDTITGGDGSDSIGDGGGYDSIFGGYGDDSITGGSGGESIDGGDGNDTITSGGGANDSIFGGSGDDSIAGSGDDTLLGGDGNDTIAGGSGDESIDGGIGDDTITNSGGSDSIFGGPGNDSISGSGDGDSIDGGDGDDSIESSGAGNDSIFGGSGDDSITTGGGSDTVDGGEGNDTISAGGDDGDSVISGGGTYDGDSIFGGYGDDSISGSDSSGETLDGGSGNDTIVGGSGDSVSGSSGGDSIFGGSGDDSISGSGDDSLDGGDGDDTISGGANGNPTISGGDGDDSILGSTGGNDSIFGGPGDDTISGGGYDSIDGGGGGADNGGGGDTIDGGDGDDTIIGSGGYDSIFGGSGDDSISGGDDSLSGGAGDGGDSDGGDTIDGGDGDDTIVGSGGYGDSIFGGSGDDSISGGGDDSTTSGSGGDSIDHGGDTIDAGDGDDTIIGGGGYGDSIFGGSGDDSIVGGGADSVPGDGTDSLDYSGDTIDGGDGDDTIVGGGYGGYGDSIFGGGGDDSIVGGGGDSVSGGGGDSTGDSGDTIDGGDGDDTIIGGGGGYDGYDSIFGGGGDDSIVGGGSDSVDGGGADSVGDTIAGGDGDDTIVGGSGEYESIDGGSGDDSIFGGGGFDDSISGGSGDDTIVGSDGDSITGSGGDSIDGGDGDDSILGGSGGYDSIFGGSGDDTIESGGGDVTIDGGDGDDSIQGGDGDEDSIMGGDGDDTIDSGGGSGDSIFGSSGNDTITIHGELAHVFAGTNTSVDRIERDVVRYQSNSNIELASGSSLNEATIVVDAQTIAQLVDVEQVALHGGDADNAISARGFVGTAILAGFGGNDTLIGGLGNDVLDGGDGHDWLDGTDGDDTYAFAQTSDTGVNTINDSGTSTADTLDFFDLPGSINLDLSIAGTQTVSAGRLVLDLVDPTQIENVVGTVFADTIFGNAANNRLIGGGGLDFIAGGAGDDYLAAARTRLVYLDFDSETTGTDHVYTATERDGILNRMQQDFAAFDVSFSLTRPDTDVYVTVLFNAKPVIGGREVSGGVADRIGFRDVARGGFVRVDVNDFLGDRSNQLPASEANLIAMSSTISSHELGHMYGLRHQDSFGAPGEGIFSGLNNKAYLPTYTGPATAPETSDHLIASPASVGTTLADTLGNPYFGEREALKLAFAESGTTVLEQPTSEKTGTLVVAGQTRTVQELGELPSMAVPNTIENPNADNYNVALDVAALNIVGAIELDGATSENDLYSFTAQAGDTITIEVYSYALRTRLSNTIDSLVRVYDPSGSKLNYYNSPLGAFNDDGFEPTDSVLVDLVIPATGTYYVEVDTFYFFNDEFPLYVPGFDATAFCQPRSGDIRCDDTDTGGYELLLYRIGTGENTTPTDPAGDFLVGGAGMDTLVSSSGNDTFLVDDNDLVLGPGARPTTKTLNQVLNTAPTVTPLPIQSVDERSSLQFTIPASDSNPGDLIRYSLVAEDGWEFPTGAMLDPVSGVFAWTPPTDGLYGFRAIATDLSGLSASELFTIQANDIDLQAAITSVSGEPNEGSEITITGIGFIPLPSTQSITVTVDVLLDDVVVASDTGTESTTLVFTPPDNGEYVIRVTAEMGTQTVTATQSLSIANVPVTFDAGPNEFLDVDVDGAFSRSLSFTDAVDEAWTATVNFGDGSPTQTLVVDPVARSFDLSHSFLERGTFTVTVSIEDGTDTTTKTFDVTVALVDPPNITALSGPNFAVAGMSLVYQVETDYPTATIDWQVTKDSVVVATGNGPSFDFVPLEAGEHTVSVTASNVGGSNSSSLQLLVSRVGVIGDDLYVAGTSGDDNLEVYRNADNKLLVYDASELLGEFDSVSGEIIINGLDGDDTILISKGISLPTQLYGGHGNDCIIGGSGADFIDGGLGDDRLSGRNGHDEIFGSEGNDWLYGGTGNDHLSGGDGDDFLEGENGHDTLHGGSGDDELNGGNGKDLLLGMEGNDRLWGGPGKDQLDGGPGDNSLTQ